jgi:glycosyltransferase involved in cell wall biosynthesis
MPKVLFLVTVDWYFWGHRRAIAKAASDAGMEVVVVTRTGSLREKMEGEGFKVVEWSNSRKSINPLREVWSLLQLVWIFLRESPDLVHNIAIKPAVYGGIAARMTGVDSKVSSITGLGYVFTSGSLKARVLRPLVRLLLQAGLNGANSLTIFQNDQDLRDLAERNVVAPSRSVLIYGSGVDVDEFRYRPEIPGPPVVALISRLIWDKGVGEFVEAARSLRDRGVRARFVIVGETDKDNPAALPTGQLREWAKEGSVEIWGYRDDIPEVLGMTHVVCLPSYREGMPRILIEAASCGRAIVTTDTPGCRDVVSHGDNGLLVPPKDSASLARAIELLVSEPALRERMGKRGRERVVEEFSEEMVVAKTLDLYRGLLRYPEIEPSLNGKQE